MAKIPSIVPVSDLRQGAAEVLERVRNSKDPVIITQRGRPAAVMIGFEAYQRGEHERQILQALARGEGDIRRGNMREL